MTKKILIFIGLKIAEIIGVCAVVGILYSTYFLLEYLDSIKIAYDISIMGWIALTLFVIFLCVVAYAIGGGIYYVIKVNWRWAERLSNK